MSDAAFKTAAYPAYTTKELLAYLSEPGRGTAETRSKMEAEIVRRAKRDAGDVSVMTNGERLRNIKSEVA